MIEQIKTFMALVPLMLPKLVDEKVPQDAELTGDSAIMDFNLKEPMNIGIIMDMIVEHIDLLLLYHARANQRSLVHHCCFFVCPKTEECLYKLNVSSNNRGEVLNVIATIYADPTVFQDELEEDLQRHSESFDFIQSMTAVEVGELFATMV